MTETALFSFVAEAEPPPCPAAAALTAPASSARAEEAPSPPEAAVPLQPPRAVALYIDGDNQSPASARELLAGVRQDWGLEIGRAVVAGNDHGQSVPRWLAALTNEGVPAERILALRVPRKPEAADLALILELGAAMERHRQGPELAVVVSRDDWLIGAGEAVRARGVRVWVAYAQSEVPPARTSLPTLLLPAVQRAPESVKAPAASPASIKPAPAAQTSVPVAPATSKAAIPPAAPSPAPLLARLKAHCKPQPDAKNRDRPPFHRAVAPPAGSSDRVSVPASIGLRLGMGWSAIQDG